MPQREPEILNTNLPEGKWDHSVLQKVQNFVSTNNTYELANTLLSSCTKLSDFETEDKLGNVEFLIQTIHNSLQQHSNDPALFTFHSLISVGVIAESRSIHRSLEKTLSKTLAKPLQRLLSSSENYEQKRNPFEPESTDNSRNTAAPSTLSSNRQEDLIAWEENDESNHFNSNFNANAKTNIPLNPKQPLPTQYSSTSHLLDDDINVEIFRSFCLTPIRPGSNNSGMSSRTPSSGLNSSWSPRTTSSASMSDTSGSEYLSDSEDGCAWINSRTFENSINAPPKPTKRPPKSLLIDTNITTETQPCLPELKLITAQKTVEHRHQRLLLGEIANGKSCLQVCALLDIFGMKPHLSGLIKESGQEYIETFGVSLVHQLLEIGEIEEAVFVISKSFESRDYILDQEIIPLLLISRDLAIVHEFVGSLQEVCIATLNIVDQAFSRLLSQWDDKGYFGISPGQVYFDTAIPDLFFSQRLDQLLETQPKFRTALVEIAVSLMMRFDLEPSIVQPEPQFPCITTFVQYITAITLLDNIPISEGFGSSLGGERMAESDSIKSSWMMLPFVINLIQGDQKTQSLVIRYCIFDKGDRITANYLAAKMNIGEVYLRWIYWSNVKASQQESDSDIATKAGTISFSESSYFEDTQSLLDVDDLESIRWSIADKPELTQATPRWDAPSTLSRPKTQNVELYPNLTSTERRTSQLFYKLPPETTVIFVDKASQFERLSKSLSYSRVVGMDSEWLSIREQNQTQDRVEEYTWFTDEMIDTSRKKYKNNGYKKHIPRRTALLQLACDHDDCVYLIDTAKFSRDLSERFGLLLADLFSNPTIQKIAYSWEYDRELLEITFPLLKQRRYRLRNLIDLRYIWIRTTTNPYSVEDSFAIGDTMNNMVNRGRKLSSESIDGHAEYLEAWSEASQGCTMKRPPHGGLSGLVQMFLGKSLNKTEQCSNWERRPLTKKQLYYA
ncbi:hypothetical protein BGZ76_000243, partial [Entomortierella beljakovae]